MGSTQSAILDNEPQKELRTKLVLGFVLVLGLYALLWVDWLAGMFLFYVAFTIWYVEHQEIKYWEAGYNYAKNTSSK